MESGGDLDADYPIPVLTMRDDGKGCVGGSTVLAEGDSRGGGDTDRV